MVEGDGDTKKALLGDGTLGACCPHGAYSRVRVPGATVNDLSITGLRADSKIGQRKGALAGKAERALSLPARMHGCDRRRDTR